MNRQLYRHFKGGIYEKLHEATEDESGYIYVVYRSLPHGSVYVRLAHEFHGDVFRYGALRSRFEFLTPEEGQKALSEMYSAEEQNLPKNGPETPGNLSQYDIVRQNWFKRLRNALKGLSDPFRP